MISVRINYSGIKETKAGLGRFRSSVNEDVNDLLKKYVEEYLLERIRLNTPILTGALRDSIHVQRVSVSGNKSRLDLGSDLSYALKTHEDEYQLGPRSKEQPMQPEGGVANKYIERVVLFHAQDITGQLKKLPDVVVRKAFRSGKVRAIRRT